MGGGGTGPKDELCHPMVHLEFSVQRQVSTVPVENGQHLDV